MYQYPYGNAQQLNLDWVLGKIQELEAGSGGDAALEEVANALVSASFDTGVSYRRYDYCFYNGKLYRALNDTTGAFNPSDWMEVTLGDDIPVLTRLLNAVDTSLTSLQNTVNDLDSDDIDNASTVVSGATVTAALETLDTTITNLQNDVNDLDSDDIDNASIFVSGATVTAALDTLDTTITNLQNDVNDLDSDDIDNASLVVSGATVTAALDTLNGAINAITPLDTVQTSGSTKGITSGAVFNALNGIGGFIVNSGSISIQLAGFGKQMNSTLLRCYFYVPWYTNGNYNVSTAGVTIEGVGTVTGGITIGNKYANTFAVDVARNGTAGECQLVRAIFNISF